MDSIFDIFALLMVLLDLSIRIDGPGLTLTVVQGPDGGSLLDVAIRLGGVLFLALALIPLPGDRGRARNAR